MIYTVIQTELLCKYVSWNTYLPMGQYGLKKSVMPKLFQDVVALYKDDRKTYERLLKEAKAVPAARSVQEQFFVWLSKEVSPAQLSELYIVYADIETFCIQRKIIKDKLFEVTDLPTIKNVMNVVESNKVFRFTYRQNLKKMIFAMRFYYRFFKEHPEFCVKTKSTLTQVQNDIKSSVSNKQSTLEPMATVPTMGKAMVDKSQQRDNLVVDLTSSERLSFTKPLFFSYFGEAQTDIGNWAQLYVQIVACLLDDYPDVLSKLMNKNISGEGRNDFADKANSSSMTAPKMVTDDFFLETNFSATDIISKIRQMLDLCNVDYENLEIHYCKKGVPNQQENTPAESTSPVTAAPDEVKAHRMQFIDWMQRGGSATATIFSYLSAIGKCTKAVQEYNIRDNDLFLLTDISELTQIKAALFEIPAFRKLNAQQHNRFHAAFMKLIAFRSETGNLVTIPAHATVQTKPVAKHAVSYIGLSPETQSRYTNILTTYFGEDGYQPGRAIFRGRFKRNYAAEYGCEPEDSEERIDDILTQIGTKRDGRIFPKQNADQSSLINDIIADVFSAFEDGASAVYIEAVYTKYQQQLADRIQIYHADALTPLLLTHAKGKFARKYSYLTTGCKNVDSAGDILRIMKGFHQPQPYDAIHEKAWYMPYEKMKSLLVVDKSIVNVAAGTYFYAPNLPVSADELRRLIAVIQQELDYLGHITDVEMMDLIEAKCPSIALNTAGYTTYGLRNCLGYILRDCFAFNGPIISSIGSELSMSDVYAEFAKKHEVLQFEDLKNFSTEMNIGIYWDSVLGEMIRISETELVRKDLINFDVDTVDAILDGLCLGDYIPLKDISLFLYFPNIGYPWNSYILESYLFSCSRKFKLLHSSFGRNGVYGAMVRADSAIRDYRSLLIDVLSNSNALSSTKAALQFIVDCGYQQRRRYDGIEMLVQEAKLIKEQKENQ